MTKALRCGETMESDATVLEVDDCCVCGVMFALPARLLANRRKQGGSFYCPNGHSLMFSKPENERLREQLQAEKDRAARLAAERDQAEASLKAQKAATTRARRRSAAGTCPCCGRTFQQLVRHMKAKHPEHAVLEPREAPNG